MTIPCSAVSGYISLVESAPELVCNEQILLCRLVRKIFESEDIYVDDNQLQTYLGYQKYFPFRLLPWETFIFALHNCTYRADGNPRFPILLCEVGRGAGKNGYVSFESFCYISPGNGIREYHVDIFATAEDQAKTSFVDVYNILQANEKKLSRFFSWNKEVITCTKTLSQLRFRTSSAKTKDGGRPGAVIFDEYHAYENPKLPNVAITGLGKKKHPRQTIITTDGDVRGGELDKLLERSMRILNGEIPDNGLLPFICRLNNIEQIRDKSKWQLANPTLRYVGESEYANTLFSEIELEYGEYLYDPISNSAFATKRMNIPQGNKEIEVTDFENLKIASRAMPDIHNRVCVMGMDFASTQDFVTAGLLFLIDGIEYWMQHTWICKQSKDLSRIRFPYMQAVEKGEATIVDAVEIDPELPAMWILEMKSKYNLTIIYGAIDHFRYTIVGKALTAAGFVPEARALGEITGNLKRIRPSDIMAIAPSLCLEFAKHEIAWGDSMMMRWFTNNAKKVIDKKGNVTFEKIEPKSRKTDGFMALVAARTVRDKIEPYDRKDSRIQELGVWTF